MITSGAGGRPRWNHDFSALRAISLLAQVRAKAMHLAQRRRKPSTRTATIRTGIVTTVGFSFPSGHAVAGAATAVALVIAFFPAGEQRRRWEWLAVAFAFVMSMSRVYLAAHWFSDVVAGTLLGAGIAVFWAATITECRDLIARARGEPIPREEAPGAPVQAGK